MVQRAKHITGTAAIVLSMLKLSWQAGPAYAVGLLALDLLQAILPVSSALLMKGIIDQLVHHMQGGAPALASAILPLLIAQVVVTILSQMQMPINSYVRAELGRRLSLRVQTMVYQKINSLPGLSHFESPHFHDTIQLASQGAQFGPLQAMGTLTAIAQSVVTLASFLGVLIVLSPFLAGMVTLAAVPQLYAQLKIGHLRVGLASTNTPKQRQVSYYGFVLSSVQFAKELRLFNVAGYFLNRLTSTSEQIYHAQRQQEQRELRWELLLGVLSSTIASASVVIVVMQAFAHRLSLGDVTLYISAVASVQTALSGIILSIAQLSESRLFFTYFMKLMALPHNLPVASTIKPVPALRSGIELRNVSFRYSEQHAWALRNINLFIPAGTCVALVGLNGAGKTTLIKLLTRLYDPTEGQVLWDGIDLRAFDPTALRDRMGTIFQDFVRYDLTAHENIAVGNIARSSNERAVQQAACDAGIHDVISGLPHSYQTVLSRWLSDEAAGADLSGGEWQKIAIARMFMRDADFLMLDEPTAALDAQAEYDIYHRFVELMSGRTSLLITHRFSTVRLADLIAVIEDGQITEYGSHDELIAHGKTYAQLYELQATQYVI